MATGVIVAGTIISAAAASYGAYQSYQTGKYNQRVAERDAEAAEAKAAYDANIHRDRVRRLISTQRALYGKSGVELTGSPLLVLEDTAAQGELDALAIRHGGSTSAARSRSEGRLAAMEGRAGAIRGAGQAGSTLLSGYGRYKNRQIKSGE
jgi:hypothetical protein